MKKSLHKAAAVLLSALMLLSLPGTAFAASTAPHGLSRHDAEVLAELDRLERESEGARTPEEPLHLSTQEGESEVYAILYEDGTLVFQKGNTPEEGRAVTEIYPVDLVNAYAYDSKAEKTSAPWFDKRESIKTVDFKDKISPLYLNFWFFNCTKLTQIQHFSNLDVTRLLKLRDAFYGCETLSPEVLRQAEQWDTSSFTDIHGVFAHCLLLDHMDLSGWDTSHITDMSGIFGADTALTELNVSNWDTSQSTTFTTTFASCTGLTELDISGWDTSSATLFFGTFWNTSGLTELDLSGWDTSAATNFMRLFRDGTKLSTIYVSEKFVSANVTAENAADMFLNCTALVGGSGTVYSEEHTDAEYARIDGPDAPGYFTGKPEPQPQKDNTVKVAKSFTRTANASKDQSFSLNASANGAPLSYKSSEKKLTVSKDGKVTVKKGFVGKATLTVTAAETELYRSASAQFKVTVNPSVTELSGVKGGRKKASVQWKKNATGKGYELQLSRKKSFSSIDKKVTVKKNTTVKATVKGLKKGKYYVRIRTVNGSARSEWSKVQTVKVS